MRNVIDLSKLPKITEKSKKRVGRGKRGARGANSGRGTKGALKRGKMAIYYEGGSLPLTKRLPKLRGKGKNKPVAPKPVTIEVEDLNRLKNGSVVNIEKLHSEGIIDKDEALQRGIKILGGGELRKKLKIENIPLSKGAEEKVKKAGGEIIS